MTVFSIQFTPEALAASAAGGLLFLIALIIITRLLSKRRIKPKKFRARWGKLQKKLPNQGKWKEALAEADKLLDEAMKKKGIKGETMGERLVNAQKYFREKNEVWFSHKLSKKHLENPDLKLKKDDIKRALLALRQALKDLGAM